MERGVHPAKAQSAPGAEIVSLAEVRRRRQPDRPAVVSEGWYHDAAVAEERERRGTPPH